MILLQLNVSLAPQFAINHAKNAANLLVPTKAIVNMGQLKSVTAAAATVPFATKPAITIVRMAHPCLMPQCVKTTLTELLYKMMIIVS